MQQVWSFDSVRYGKTFVWLIDVDDASQITEGIVDLFENGLSPGNLPKSLAILNEMVSVAKNEKAHSVPAAKFVRYVAKNLGYADWLTKEKCLLMRK